MKFRMKMALAMLVLVTAAYSLGCSLVIAQSHKSALQSEKERALGAYRIAVTAVGLVNGMDTHRSLSNISATLRGLAPGSGWQYVSLRGGEGAIFEYGDRDGLDLESETEQGHSLCVISREDRRYILVSGELEANGRTVSLSALTDISGIYRVRDGQIRTCRRVFCVLFFLCGTGAWLISWWLTRPLSKMSSAAKKIAGGDLGQRVAVASRDELGDLARDFSKMAEKLQENVGAIREEAQRREQFMASFAHELKTPMTSVIGYADLIRTDALDRRETMEAANYIFSEGKRLESLSLKLLELIMAREEQVSLVPTDMERLVAATVNRLRPVYREQGVDIKCRTAPGSWRVDGDLISSLLINLADNARKAMEGSGNIYIVLDWPENACRLRVLDNGRGMPPEVLGRLTEAFYRVDKSRSRAQGGVGLGLALCDKIARLHNGKIEFDSRVDNGTCVTVTLGGENGES